MKPLSWRPDADDAFKAEQISARTLTALIRHSQSHWLYGLFSLVSLNSHSQKEQWVKIWMSDPRNEASGIWIQRWLAFDGKDFAFSTLINCKEYFCILSTAPPSILEGGMKKLQLLSGKKSRALYLPPQELLQSQSGGSHLSPDCLPAFLGAISNLYFAQCWTTFAALLQVLANPCPDRSCSLCQLSFDCSLPWMDP